MPMPQPESSPELRGTPPTPLARLRRWPTLQPTNSVPPLMRSRQRELQLRRARAIVLVGASAAGSVSGCRWRFAILCWMTSGCATRSVGRCSIASACRARQKESREACTSDTLDLAAALLCHGPLRPQVIDRRPVENELIDARGGEGAHEVIERVERGERVDRLAIGERDLSNGARIAASIARRSREAICAVARRGDGLLATERTATAARPLLGRLSCERHPAIGVARGEAHRARALRRDDDGR